MSMGKTPPVNLVMELSDGAVFVVEEKNGTSGEAACRQSSSARQEVCIATSVFRPDEFSA